MKAHRGQIAILLAAALLAVIVLAVMNVSVFLAVRSKNRAMNAGDAAALAVAKYQGELINRIGRLNIEHLKAALADDKEACARIMSEQRRICFLDPMQGIAIGNNAARENGVERDASDGMLRILREHVIDVRRVFAVDTDLYPEPWEGAWTEYADVLETVVGSLGGGLVAGPDNIEFANAWECFPLLKKQFYNAVAGRSWCWFHFNGEWVLDRDSHNMPRPDFSSPHRHDNSEIYSLHLEFRPILALDDEWRRLIMRLTDCDPVDIDRAEALITSDGQEWAFFDGLWRTWWEMDPNGEQRFPVIGPVKPEYDVRGCAAICRVTDGFDDLVDGGGGVASWMAAAKPFGTVTDLDGATAPVTALKEFVTPAFTAVRLVPVDSVGGADLSTADAGWVDHIKKHLPRYYGQGPYALPSECWWCSQLRTWENPVFRASGKHWLKHNSSSCVRPTGGAYDGIGGTPHGH